jgi:hypothetical protein
MQVYSAELMNFYADLKKAATASQTDLHDTRLRR